MRIEKRPDVTKRGKVQLMAARKASASSEDSASLPESTPAPSRSRRKSSAPALVSPASVQAAESAAPDLVSTVDALAEARLISSVLAHPDSLDDLLELSPEHFGVPAHSMIWAAILAADASGQPVDAVTVAHELARLGTLDRIGGPAGLDRIRTAPPALDELEAYLSIVMDRSLRRKLAAAAHRIAQSATSGAGDASLLAAAAQEDIFAATNSGRESTSIKNMPQVLDVLKERMATSRSSKLIGYATGLEELDEVTGGFSPGQLIVIGARPAMGKSVLLLQLARTIAEGTGLVVPFYSYEMSIEEIGFRLLSSSTGIPMPELMRGWVPSGMDRVLAAEVEKLKAVSLLLDDSPPPTVGALRAAVRRQARRAPVGAVVVDYMQLMKGDARRSENRTQEVSEISRELKLMAKELKTVVIAASQLNRQVESRAGAARRPQLSDLRESGCLPASARILRADTGAEVTIGELYDQGATSIPVWSFDDELKCVPRTMTHVFRTGHKEVFSLRTASGRTLEATASHPLLTYAGWKPLGTLAAGDRIAVPRLTPSTRDVLEDVPVTSDVFWDEIVEVESIGFQDVFDATVPGTHNFIANNVIVHNSVEQDANLVMFLHRESMYSLEAPQDEAELIIGKNRQGPSGITIPLRWEGSTVRFKPLPKTQVGKTDDYFN